MYWYANHLCVSLIWSNSIKCLPLESMRVGSDKYEQFELWPKLWHWPESDMAESWVLHIMLLGRIFVPSFIKIPSHIAKLWNRHYLTVTGSWRKRWLATVIHYITHILSTEAGNLSTNKKLLFFSQIFIFSQTQKHTRGLYVYTLYW